MPYIGKAPKNSVRSRFTYQATAGQTSFSGSDSNALTLSYVDSLYMDVYQNGVLLKAGTDYTATTGTTVVLVSSASADDVVEMVVYDVFDVADTYSTSNADSRFVNVTGDSMTGDFSVDSPTFTVDSSNNRIGLGTASPTAQLHIVGDDTSNQVIIENTDTSASSAPDLMLLRTSTSSAADDDVIGRIDFAGLNDANEQINYFTITARIDDNTDSTENGMLRLQQILDGSFFEPLVINGNAFIKHKSVGSSFIGETGNYNEFISATNNINTMFYTNESSYTSRILDIRSTRAANSAYNFILCYSSGGSDIEFNLRGDGNAYADGSWSGSGADYAEFFETTDGKAITLGTTVVLDGGKIRASTDGDAQTSILGVIRPKGVMHKASMTIGNTAWNHWTDKYLTDDFEQYIMEEHTVTEWYEKNEQGENILQSFETDKIPSNVTPPSDAVVVSVEKDGENKGQKLKRKKLNPSYDASKVYVNREGRDEWQVVGLLGQVRITKGQTVGDRWIKMRDISSTVEEWMIR